jgi:uncharacterized membrane protein YhdT
LPDEKSCATPDSGVTVAPAETSIVGAKLLNSVPFVNDADMVAPLTLHSLPPAVKATISQALLFSGAGSLPPQDKKFKYNTAMMPIAITLFMMILITFVFKFIYLMGVEASTVISLCGEMSVEASTMVSPLAEIAVEASMMVSAEVVMAVEYAMHLSAYGGMANEASMVGLPFYFVMIGIRITPMLHICTDF